MGGVLIAIVLGITAYALFDRWCDHKLESLRIQAHMEEIRCCYDSEQSFIGIKDDEEHLASISPGMPSLTEEERAEAQRELDEDETA